MRRALRKIARFLDRLGEIGLLGNDPLQMVLAEGQANYERRRAGEGKRAPSKAG